MELPTNETIKLTNAFGMIIHFGVYSVIGFDEVNRRRKTLS